MARRDRMFVDQSAMRRDEWAGMIDELGCKLRIFITDCCSSYPPGYEIAEGDEEVHPWGNLYSLLLEHEGFVNITAASPGQPAYSTDVGGFLTINLESDMQRYRTWSQVFQAAQARVFDETQAEIKRAGGGAEMLPQRPLAYSLGRPTFDPATAAKPAPDVVKNSANLTLSREELRGMGLQQLYLARNEIYARHGYDFSHPFLQQYFGSQRWYRRRAGLKDPLLSSIENANTATIQAVEREMGGPLAGGKSILPGESQRAAPDILPYSSRTSLSRSLLQNLTPKELSIVHNEIYARHGYPFTAKALQDYFGRKAYYRRNPAMQYPPFNAVEDHNLWLIRKIERIKGGAYGWK